MTFRPQLGLSGVLCNLGIQWSVWPWGALPVGSSTAAHLAGTVYPTWWTPYTSSWDTNTNINIYIYVFIYAAAAESLQSCLILCDPIDSSPRGSSVPGILQARTLEWVAISFSIYIYTYICIHTHTHIYIYVCIHTHTHTHAYMYVLYLKAAGAFLERLRAWTWVSLGFEPRVWRYQLVTPERCLALCLVSSSLKSDHSDSKPALWYLLCTRRCSKHITYFWRTMLAAALWGDVCYLHVQARKAGWFARGHMW